MFLQIFKLRTGTDGFGLSRAASWQTKSRPVPPCTFFFQGFDFFPSDFFQTDFFFLIFCWNKNQKEIICNHPSFGTWRIISFWFFSHVNSHLFSFWFFPNGFSRKNQKEKRCKLTRNKNQKEIICKRRLCRCLADYFFLIFQHKIKKK